MFRKLAVLTGSVCAIALLVISVTTPVLALDPGQVGPWTTSPNSLPDSLEAPGYASYNGYAYVMGGFNADPWSDEVYYAKLNSDGTVDSWTTSSNPLPHVVGYPSAAAYNGYMYVMGGYGSGYQDVVYYAPINNDGSLGTWTTSANALPEALYESAAVAVNDRLYLFGGTTSGSSIGTDAIYTAPINNDGSVGTWTTSSSTLPTPLRLAASAYSSGRIYLAGGDNNSLERTTNVYYAELNTDGSIGTWTTSSSSLPVAVASAAGIAAGGYFYVVGGNIAISTRTDAVYYAPFNDDGSIGTWTLSDNALPAPRQGSAIFAANSYLFVAGGHNGAASDAVFSAFAEPAATPPTPTPSSDAAATTSATLADTGSNQDIPLFMSLSLLAGGIVLIVRAYRYKNSAQQ